MMTLDIFLTAQKGDWMCLKEVIRKTLWVIFFTKICSEPWSLSFLLVAIDPELFLVFSSCDNTPYPLNSILEILRKFMSFKGPTKCGLLTRQVVSWQKCITMTNVHLGVWKGGLLSQVVFTCWDLIPNGTCTGSGQNRIESGLLQKRVLKILVSLLVHFNIMTQYSRMITRISL